LVFAALMHASSVLSMLTPATSGRLASAISSARRFASSRQPFAQGLADIEFVEERNVHIEYRWAEGDYGHKPSAYEVKAVVGRTQRTEFDPQGHSTHSTAYRP
jgi:hypothetical protein